MHVEYGKYIIDLKLINQSIKLGYYAAVNSGSKYSLKSDINYNYSTFIARDRIPRGRGGATVLGVYYIIYSPNSFS